MEDWLRGLDPSTRYGLLLALLIGLPLTSVVLVTLLGYVVGYAREKPAPSRILSVMMVGTITLLAGVAGVVTWVYMHGHHGCFPGKWAWIWGAAWLGFAAGSFEIPKQRYGKKRRAAA